MNQQLDDIKKYLYVDLEVCNRLMANGLESEIAFVNQLNDYLLSNPGKQIRPIVAFLVARACGVGSCPLEGACYVAATELLHNATLLHDDVVDGANSRRGEATLASKQGAPTSVLLGDYWLSRALQQILSAKPVVNQKVLQMYSQTLADLAEGELLQIEKSKSLETDEGDYLTIIYKKTASLFQTTCTATAIAVGAPEGLQTAMGLYGRAVGMAFQIKDDLLDYVGDPEKTGKPVGQDIAEGKITLPLLGAFLNMEPEEIDAFVEELKANPSNSETVAKAIALAKEKGGVEHAEKALDLFVKTAIENLEPLRDLNMKKALKWVAEYIGRRDY